MPGRPIPDKVILVHNGALGDFLVAWPCALAVSRCFPGAGLFWAGGADRLRWLAPLGFTPCSPRERHALDRAYGATAWPTELDGRLVVWPVVDRVPDVPPSDACWFLRAMDADPVRGKRGRHVRAKVHVRESYARALTRRGVVLPPDWPAEFKRLFAAKRSSSKTVLLFPGAGHPLKQWPLVQYFLLAERLELRGFRPVFVLGPAELDRGLVPRAGARATPGNLEELEGLIMGARAVIGGDTGPMHLAGMLGVPGVSLFGPTSFAQWGPPGMAELSLDLPCSPCTATCADLACEDPRCLSGITPDMVMEKLEEELDKCKTGFQGPGFLESRLWQKEEGMIKD